MTTVIETLAERIRAAEKGGDFPRAVQIAREALTDAMPTTETPETPETPETASHRAAILRLLAELYVGRAATAEAIPLLRECLQIHLSLGDPRAIAATLVLIGRAYHLATEFSEALTAFGRAIALYEEIGDDAGLGEALSETASVHKSLGDAATALELLHRCLPLVEKSGDRVRAAKVRFNMVNAYNVLKQPEEAIALAEETLPALEDAGDRRLLSVALNMTGTAYANAGRPEDALRYLERSRALAEEIGHPWVVALSLSDIGEVLTELGRFDDACDALERSLSILTDVLDHPTARCECLCHLGKLNARLDYPGHDDARALALLTDARMLAESLDLPTQLRAVYEALTDLHERLGNFADALAFHRKLYAADKRLFNEEFDRRVRSLEVRFAVERARKDAEIAHLRTVELAAALAEAERLRKLADERAITDSLTGVYNRRFVDERLETEVTRSLRYQRPLSVAMLDIDDFKRLNDRFGHGIGDQVLRRIAWTLRDNCRSAEAVARYGGEEFALLLPETGAEDAATLCERLRAAVAATDLRDIHPEMPPVTLSAGIAGLRLPGSKGGIGLKETAEEASDLLGAADRNLYAAKRLGKNRVVAG